MYKNKYAKGKYDECNLVGVRFGRLLVTPEHDGRSPSARKYVCICDCGKQKAIAACSLINGPTRSCGCAHKEIVSKHGHSVGHTPSPTYRSWVAMTSRCNNPYNAHYYYYGGRGVTVCPEWGSFETFLADMGERPEGTSLDRIGDALLYSKDTCRWATSKEQQENRRVTLYVEYKGEIITLMEAAELTGILPVTLRQRLNKGMAGAALFNRSNLRRTTT